MIQAYIAWQQNPSAPPPSILNPPPAPAPVPGPDVNALAGVDPSVATDKPPDVVLHAEVGDYARTELDKLPKRVPLEFAFRVYRTTDGRLIRGHIFTSPTTNPFNTVLGSEPSLGKIVAVVHTHPYFTDADWRALNPLSTVPASRQNQAGRQFATKGNEGRDDDAITKLGVVNIMRTPDGKQIKVLERIDGKLTTRTIWPP